MNKIFKLMSAAFFVLILAAMQVKAADKIESVIKKSNLNNTSTIAVSVRNAKNGNEVFKYNQDKLMNPASALKAFTMKPVYDLLGADYKFTTYLYKDKKNNLYIKLSGDPSFTTQKLTELLKNNKGPVNDIVIDSSATDYIEWGIGWMWDDDASSYFPKYSPYTINNNMIKVDISPAANAGLPQIKNCSGYSIVLVNMLSAGDENKFSVSRQPWQSSDTTLFSGSIKEPVSVMIPVDNTERYFITCLKEAAQKAGVRYSGNIKTAPVLRTLKPIASVESDALCDLISVALKDSNNLYAELLLKAGGAKFSKAQGTTARGIDLFKDSYSGLKSKPPLIVDGCGISRNNLITASWMSEALHKIYNDKNFEEYEQLLPKPIEGTLSDRLINISRFLRAKTGTMSGVSSLTGYVTAKNGTKYSFAILIQNFDVPIQEVKMLEDKIVNAIYEY